MSLTLPVPVLFCFLFSLFPDLLSLVISLNYSLNKARFLSFFQLPHMPSPTMTLVSLFFSLFLLPFFIFFAFLRISVDDMGATYFWWFAFFF